MNRLFSLIAIICVLMGAVSCKNRKHSAKTDSATTEVASPGIDGLLSPTGDTLMLSAQKLTSWDAMMKAFYNGNEADYLHEPTSAEKAFFQPEADIKDTELTKVVMLRHNYCAVMNRVLHGYEWFQRISSDGSAEEEGALTKKDTLRWILLSQPRIDDSFITLSLNRSSAADAARRLVRAYRLFDGNDEEGTPFYKAFQHFREVFDYLPAIVTEEELDSFEKEFWGWYNKEQFVPGISALIKMNMKGYEGENLTEDQVKKLVLRVKSEKDIDKRTILALELVKFDRQNGTILLGDIIESGLYTRYLLEAWISWRANAQMEHSPSSFSVIPNNYYDLIRVKCLNTMLRHCQEADDYRTRCLMENLILCELVHRMGSLAGNSSFLTCMHLSFADFIHPDLLPKDNE